MSRVEANMYQALLAKDTEGLVSAAEAGLSGNIADVCCYYMNWSHKPELV